LSSSEIVIFDQISVLWSSSSLFPINFFFACTPVKGAPCRVQMLEDLEWGDVVIGQVAMPELGIKLFFESIAKVRGDALQESLPNI
jgi:hypothetical protein